MSDCNTYHNTQFPHMLLKVITEKLLAWVGFAFEPLRLNFYLVAVWRQAQKWGSKERLSKSKVYGTKNRLQVNCYNLTFVISPWS